MQNDNRRADERKWKGDKYLLHYFNYEVANKKYVIWAVTAAILIRAATIVLQRPPDFLEMRPEMWGGVTESDRIILQNSSSKQLLCYTLPSSYCMFNLWGELLGGSI